MYSYFLLLAFFTSDVSAHVGRVSAEQSFHRNPEGREIALARFLFALAPAAQSRNAATRASSSRMQLRQSKSLSGLSEYAASRSRKAWFETLDAPTWNKASAAMKEVASKGPAWASAAKAVEMVNEVASSGKDLSEEEAKKQWLAKLDAPEWGKAAQAVNEAATKASQMAKLEDDCSAGVDTACDVLSKEEQAKRKWLAKLDQPTWKRVRDTVSGAAAAAQNPRMR